MKAKLDTMLQSALGVQIIRRASETVYRVPPAKLKPVPLPPIARVGDEYQYGTEMRLANQPDKPLSREVAEKWRLIENDAHLSMVNYFGLNHRPVPPVPKPKKRK